MKHSLFLHDVVADLQAPPKGTLKHIPPERLFSSDALRRAWLKVKAAGGGAGVDAVSIADFETKLPENLAALRRTLLAGDYRPQPVKRLLVPKAGQALRPLALWTLGDKIVQRVVADAITPYFERIFLDCSYGFRLGLGVQDAVEALAAHYQGYRRWVADVDIKDCFDSLDTALVMQLVRKQVQDATILGLIQAWLNARVFNDWYAPGPAGASQGNVISPLLANIYLHEVDLMITRQGYHLIRYADDLLICCRRKREAEEALQVAEAALARVKLRLNPHKSRLVHFDQGFQFLGYFFVANRYYRLEG